MYNNVNIIYFKGIFKKWFKDAPSEDKDIFKQLFLTIFDTIINEGISTKDSSYFYNIIEDLII
ncbi:MAG TPA: hypothetical protein PK993_06090 [Clostridia bacterium]|nr:hypothetical protein [Clostridia bacterium]